MTNPVVSVIKRKEQVASTVVGPCGCVKPCGLRLGHQVHWGFMTVSSPLWFTIT